MPGLRARRKGTELQASVRATVGSIGAARRAGIATLSQQAPGAGADREARGPLAPPDRGPDEHHVREIDAAHEQDDDGVSPQEVETARSLADNEALKWHRPRREADVDQRLSELGHFVEVGGVECVDLVPQRLERRAGGQPADL
jgi:hypothetical protein